MIACLRRVDCGDPVDSVLRDYPDDAAWLREHLTVSDALRMTGEPSAEKKNRARESLLSAVAHSDRPAKGATRLRLGFVVAQVALIVVACLGVTAGAAAASGVNLRSVAREVVDSLAEPLAISPPPPISAEEPHAPIELDSKEQPAGGDSATGERLTRELDDGGVDADESTPSDAPAHGDSDDTNTLAQVDPSDRTNPPSKKPPEDKPVADSPAADDSPEDDDQGGPHSTPPGETGPPPTPGTGGPPDGNGHDGQPGHNGPNDGQPGENGPNGNGSTGSGPNGGGSSGGGPNGGGSSGGGSNGGGSSGGGPNGEGSSVGGPNGDGSSGGGPNGEGPSVGGSNGDSSNGNNGGNGGSSNDPNGGGSGDQCGGASTGPNPGDKGGKGGPN